MRIHASIRPTVSVEDHVQFSEYGQTGLAFGVQDDRNYLLAKISVTRGKATGTICRVTNGSETTLNSFSVGVVRLDQEYWLRVEVKDGSVRFAVNGNVMILFHIACNGIGRNLDGFRRGMHDERFCRVCPLTKTPRKIASTKEQSTIGSAPL